MFEVGSCSAYTSLPKLAVNPGVGNTQMFMITVYPPPSGGKSFYIVSTTDTRGRTFFATYIKGKTSDIVNDDRANTQQLKVNT